MFLALFNSVPVGAIETLFDDQNQPWFKRADLGRYLGIVKVKNSMHIPSHFMCKRQDIRGPCRQYPDQACGEAVKTLRMCLSI